MDIITHPWQYAYNFTYHLQAVERKSRLGNAAVRQQIQLSEDSSRSVDPATPVQKEEGVPQSTPTPPTQKALDAAAPCPGSTQAVASTSTAYLAEGKPKASSSSPSDCSFQTPSRPNDPALADLMEKELSSSIEQIEKMVRKNLKRAPKAAQPSKMTIQKRTLLSMRWDEMRWADHTVQRREWGLLRPATARFSHLSAAFLAASPSQTLCISCSSSIPAVILGLLRHGAQFCVPLRGISAWGPWDMGG